MKLKVLGYIFFVAAAGLFIGACASAPKGPAVALVGTPDWFLNPPQSTTVLYGTGTAKKQSLSLAKTTADNRAIEAVAQQVSTRVKSMFKDFMKETGVDTNSEYLELTEKTTKNIVNVTLKGVKIEKRAVGPDQATVYSLASYPVAGINNAVAESIKKEQNLYTKFQASQSFKELEKSTTQQ